MPALTDEQTAVIARELATIHKARAVLPAFVFHQNHDRAPAFACLDKDSLRYLAGLQNYIMDRNFTSHRKILGPLIVLMKKNFNKIFNSFLLKINGRQVAFNQEMCNLALLVRIQNERLDRIEQILSTLKAEK